MQVCTLRTCKLVPDPLLCIVLQKLNYFTKQHTKPKASIRNNCAGKMAQGAFSYVYHKKICQSFIWIISIYLAARDFSEYSEIPWRVSKILHMYLLHGISYPQIVMLKQYYAYRQEVKLMFSMFTFFLKSSFWKPRGKSGMLLYYAM